MGVIRTANDLSSGTCSMGMEAILIYRQHHYYPRYLKSSLLELVLGFGVISGRAVTTDPRTGI